MKLKMVDLKGQYEKIKNQIQSGFEEVLDNTSYINGPQVHQFQQNLEQYLDVKHVIPCANGTDALQIALMALDLQPGDEVITPSFTYIASVEVVGLLGLKPVFVDVDPDTFTMSIEDLAYKITDNTKVIIPVHLYGQCANMEAILAMASAKNIVVIEDTAQALGADYIWSDGTKKKAGTMGKIGTTSFFPSKNLGCYGDGGAMMTNDDLLASKMRMIANHGQSKKYVHDVVGCNSRLDSLQAVVLNVKLPHLDAYCAAREAAADYYDKAFATSTKITTPARAPYSTHVFHQYTIKLAEGIDRNAVQEKLEGRGIPTMIYYPIPCHRQKMFEIWHTDNQQLPVTDSLTHRVLSLPIHTELTDAELKYITDNLLEVIG